MTVPAVSLPTNIITVQDAVSDTPAFRSNVEHFEDQVELLERWLENLVRSLKHYSEELSRLNMQTTDLSKKAVPNVDESVMNPDFANAVVRSFTDSLQASLAFKQKMVSDMEERMIAPTQLFIKTEMKEFKETRKNYNKTLEKYESMLYRYNALSKTKEASALREDAFQLYEIRKSHIRVSAEYMLKITEFKAALEHMLVEQFVNGIQAEADYHEGSYEVYKSLRKPITQWRAWLGESKSTIDYQLSLLRASRKPLEEEAITLARPQRSLTNYNAPSSISLFSSPTSNANAASPITKHGYLYQRTVTGKPARFVWSRRWFFVEDGWFGSLTVGTVGKVKGCVMLGERVGVLLCDVKQNSEQDRRFCFEVVCVKPQASFLLQAETEDDLQEWMLTFESARRFIVENAQQPLDASNPTNIDTPTAATSSATTETRDESTEPPAAEVDKDGSDTAAGGSGSDSERRTKSARSSLGPNTSIADLTGGVPISPTHSPTTLNRPPSTGSSLAGMMIREAARQGTDLMYKASGGTNPSSSSIAGAWGSIPWTLVPGASLFINNQGNGEGEPGIFNSGGALVEGYSVDGGVVSLPTTTTGRDRSGSLSGASRPRSGSGGTGGLERLNSAVIGAGDDDLKVTEITGYPPDLDVRNKQLRRLFQSVEKDEVVLDAFLSALVQKPTDASKDVTSSSTSTSPAPPRSSYGYSYPGRSFLTQRALYFHSRVVMNCVNTVTLRLKDVISIKLVRDASPIPGGDVLLVFEISAPVGGSQEKEKLMLRVLMDDAELIMEKINMTAATAKADQSMKLQHLFEVLRSMRKGVSVYVAPTPAVTPPPTQKETKGTDEAKVVTEMLAPATKKESDAEKQKEASGGPPAGESSKASEEKQKEQATPVDEDTLPPDFPIPAGPEDCGCEDHLEKKEVELELNMSAHRLFDLMFSDAKAPMTWEKLNKQRGNTDIQVGQWEMVEGEKRRILKYTMPINNPMVKAKETEVLETHQLLQKREYLAYTVHSSTKTAQLPYADAFSPTVKYCITYVGPKKCKLACYTGIKWYKNPMVKSMISKVTMKGLSETVAVIANVIQSDVQHLTHSGAGKLQRPGHRVDRSGTSHHGNRTRYAPSGSSLRRRNRVHDDGSSATEGVTGESASVERKKSMKKVNRESTGGILGSILDAGEALLDMIPLEKRLFVGVLLVVSLLWNMWALITIGTRSTVNGVSVSSVVTPMVEKHVEARAVYIRDLEEGLLKSAGWVPVGGKYESYNLFLRSRPSFSPTFASPNVVASINISEDPTASASLPYNWFTKYHRVFASELVLTRERVGILRHDLLLTFQVLNDVEKRLLESEYVNWLLDGRARCVREETQQGHRKLCEEVEQQLVDFLMPSTGVSRK